MQKNYVIELDELQIPALKSILDGRGWKFSDVPYAYWRAVGDKVNVTAYYSGKLVVQGAGTADFVRFVLEPEITGEAKFDYRAEMEELSNPEMFAPHAGIDESGKGDFFGPLVVACCYTDAASAKVLLDAGVADSKTIGTDKKMFELEEKIKKHCAGKYALVILPPETYNRLYDSMNNLNRLLGWGHAKSLEKLLEKVPDCPRAISDQFGRKDNVLNALQERGRRIVLDQHPKAETDVAVAAASILARAEFVRRMKALSEEFGLELPKGAGPMVKTIGRQFVESHGRDALVKVAKLHFKTAAEL